MDPLIRSIYRLMITHNDDKTENGYDLMINRLQEQIKTQHACKKSAVEIMYDYHGIDHYMRYMMGRRYTNDMISAERLKEVKETVVTFEMKVTGKIIEPIVNCKYYHVPGFVPTCDIKLTKGVFKRADTKDDEAGDE